MKVLMINKFLYPNGGSETYIFKLGKYLEKQGHEVQYFGMEHEGCCKCVHQRYGFPWWFKINEINLSDQDDLQQGGTDTNSKSSG